MIHLRTETIKRLLPFALRETQSVDFIYPPDACVTEKNKSDLVESDLNHDEFVGEVTSETLLMRFNEKFLLNSITGDDWKTSEGDIHMLLWISFFLCSYTFL